MSFQKLGVALAQCSSPSCVLFAGRSLDGRCWRSGCGREGSWPCKQPGRRRTRRDASQRSGSRWAISCACCVQSPAAWQIKRTIWQKRMNEGVKTCSWCRARAVVRQRCNARGPCKGQQERRGVTARCTSCGHLQMARCCCFWVRCDFSLGLGFLIISSLP